jgi:hypothetical protein
MTRPFFFERSENDDMMSKYIHFVHNEFQYKRTREMKYYFVV